MSETASYGYGLWPLVVINAGIFILFAISVFKPRTRADWRVLGTFSAFVVALFTEMYGFPLTIYLLSSWLLARAPQADLFGHDAGHLWATVLALPGNPHFSPIHLLSTGIIFAGFWLLAAAWRRLHRAQQQRRIATSGPYRYLRHPQYAGFVLIMIGFLLQWPTIVTALMFPVLVWLYVRLAHREEREAVRTFGPIYRQYMATVPAFLPRLGPLLAH